MADFDAAFNLVSIDLGMLRELVEPADATFTSVYVADAGSGGRAAAGSQTHRQMIASRLASAGAPAADIDAICRAWAATGGGSDRFLVACDGETRLTQCLPGAVTTDVARVGAPPPLGPLLAWWQRHPAYVVSRDVDAAKVLALARSSGADLVLAAQDHTDDLVNQVRGLAPSITVLEIGSGPVTDESIQQVLDDYAAATSAELRLALDAFAVPHSVAVQGVHATLAALAVGRVDTVLVVDDPDDRRSAWFGPVELCASLPDPVHPQRTPHGGRLVDVAIRAALLTGARIRILSGDQARGLRGGLGALIR
ncbi:hypothetical protein HDA40_007259 [Hamadaea flava]|uniref:Uncharacterized protein n=1 Tax=Hamadaea flava TaxID=1742688 RepID=A0ABV8LTM6_9ACTN|nr:hypothetical protein [Hamadaea flava]MCP2328752.1 hypothetical protein [Hamadaea flava]